jgi:hypothetical protein
LASALTALVEDRTGGDPMGRGKWVRRSLRKLSGDLGRQGHPACPNTVRRLLRAGRFGLRANVKRLCGPPHPQREQQFQHIAQQRQSFLAAGQPVLSIDAKKKELVGSFKNPGRTWARQPEPVNTYDFIQDAQCRATPYGLYDLAATRGAVGVGTSADTAEFAVDCLAAWWERTGRQSYPDARQILLLADGGGSNGHRCRLFKRQLQGWSDRTGLAVTVCHYPRGASKWNPIEHQLFSQISVNWAGVPLRTVDTMLACIRGTSTATGLRVDAWLMDKSYPTKVKVSNAEMNGLILQRSPTCPDLNYTLRPRPTAAAP